MFFTSCVLFLGLATGPAATAGQGKVPPPVAGIVSVKAARAAGVGSTVTVRAIVLNGPELGALRFVQDGEAGLALYTLPGRLPGYDELRAGDSVQVTGQLKNYQGLLEMDPISSVQKLSSNRRLHPLKLPVAALSSSFIEANEGRLLEINGVSRLTTTDGKPADALVANTNYLLDGQAASPLRVTVASTGPTGLVNASPPKGELFDVRGVLSQFSPSGTGGYQLLPRLATDLVRGGGLPRISAEPIPVSITPQGFTLEFSTAYPGDTRVSYGPSATDLTDTRVEEAVTIQHRITLDGLEPGTTYYVKVSSRNAAGTASAAAVPIITGGKKSSRSRR